MGTSQSKNLNGSRKRPTAAQPAPAPQKARYTVSARDVLLIERIEAWHGRHGHLVGAGSVRVRSGMAAPAWCIGCKDSDAAGPARPACRKRPVPGCLVCVSCYQRLTAPVSADSDSEDEGPAAPTENPTNSESSSNSPLTSPLTPTMKKPLKVTECPPSGLTFFPRVGETFRNSWEFEDKVTSKWTPLMAQYRSDQALQKAERAAARAKAQAVETAGHSGSEHKIEWGVPY